MKLIFWLEEYSAQVMLENMIPNLFNNKTICLALKLEYYHFQGKSDLKKNILQKLNGYYDGNEKVAHLILMDQDYTDC